MKKITLSLILLFILSTGCTVYWNAPLEVVVNYHAPYSYGTLVIEYGPSPERLFTAQEAYSPGFPYRARIYDWDEDNIQYVRATLYQNNIVVAMDEMEINSNYYQDEINLYLTDMNYDAYEPDNTMAEASTFTVNSTAYSHTLHHGEDEDWFKVYLTAGRIYTFYTSIPTGEKTDTILSLFTSYGDLLAVNDDVSGYNGDYSSKIENYTCYSSGYYYLKVEAVNYYGSQGIGRYYLTVNDNIP